MADRPGSLGKFSLLPLQILSFAQGRKNWSPAPQWAACDFAIFCNFFDRQGLRVSLTQTLKNEEPSRAPPENALAFYKFSFFLYQVRLALIFFCFYPTLIFFSYSFSIFWLSHLISEKLIIETKKIKISEPYNYKIL